MKKSVLLIFMMGVLFMHNTKGQVLIDTISLVANEETNTQFCFNNTKLMAGNSISDRYIVYYNVDTIFLNVNQSGIWNRKVAYTGNNIQSATLCFYKDTIWLCWKEGFTSGQIKARYTSDKGNSWSVVLPVSPIGKVLAWLTKDTINNVMNILERRIYHSNTTGINTLEQGMSPITTLFPNPFSVETTLRSQEILDDATLTIYNTFVQELKKIKNISWNEVTLLRDNSPSGTYFIRLIQNNKASATARVLITD
jgi:hypothetical protein